MLRALTRLWLALVMLAWGSNSLFAFSLLGPINEAYQVTTLGYNLAPPNYINDVGAPKNIGQWYRYNTRTIYYAADEAFITYFGTNGVNEADKAFAAFNSLSNVDAYSPDLSEIPLKTSRVNFSAAQVGLVDLKSAIMNLAIEQLGLAEPDRWTYALHSRALPTGAVCPNYDYFVIVRNYDPTTYQYSPYVNGVLYTFGIRELCNATAAQVADFQPEMASAVKVPVDPTQLAETDSAVAARANLDQESFLTNVFVNLFGLNPGAFYTGLTRDDVGGLRYLWSSNRIATEAVSADSLQVVSNAPVQIVTSNLAILLSLAAVETPAELLTNFPTLQITSSNQIGTSNVVTPTTVTVTVTNPPPPQSPAGTLPIITTNTITVLTTNFQPIFAYTFGNVINPLIYFDDGVLVTNFAEYIFTPTNTCGFTILSDLGPAIVTNTGTSPPTITIDHTLAVEIPTCVAAAAQLREGMEHINFVRVDFDSFIGQTWGPVSNTYSLTAITNSQLVTQSFQRRVTAPDITLTTADELGGPAALTQNEWTRTGGPTFNTSTVLANQFGPGTLTPGGIDFTFNAVGPVFENAPAPFIGGGIGTAWASYDASTNIPVIYPTTATLQSLLNSALLQITLTGPLPSGQANSFYSFQLPASGTAPPPYNWQIVPGTGGLPNGLNLSSSGLISGVPTTAGIYDVAVSVSDNFGHGSQAFITIEIDPN